MTVESVTQNDAQNPTTPTGRAAEWKHHRRSASCSFSARCRFENVTATARRWSRWLATPLLIAMVVCVSGCTEKEPASENVIDIKAPGVEIKVNKTEDGASVDVQTPTSDDE